MNPSTALIFQAESNNLPDLSPTQRTRVAEAMEASFWGDVSCENTRAAYGRAVKRFLAWLAERGFNPQLMGSIALRSYFDQMGDEGLSLATQKQHHSAIRRFYEALVTAQVIERNPMLSVRAPRLSVREGSTPALTMEEFRHLVATIEEETIKGKRDRALISLLMTSMARISSVLAMNRSDYIQTASGFELKITDKGNKQRRLPVHSICAELMADYLKVAPEGSTSPLWQGITQSGVWSGVRLNRSAAGKMIQARGIAAGLGEKYRCHSMRATGITALLEEGVGIDVVQDIAGHASSATTRLYDRRERRIKQNDIERIRF